MCTEQTKSKVTRLGRTPIRVLIVDDHAVVRQGLRTFLELQYDVSPGSVSRSDPATLPIEVVAEAANGVLAVELARRLQPDVLPLDLVMSGRTHCSSILGKVHVEDCTRAAIYALRHGLAPDSA
jgi:DNA-binding NarL/FixJ family response regulator